MEEQSCYFQICFHFLLYSPSEACKGHFCLIPSEFQAPICLPRTEDEGIVYGSYLEDYSVLYRSSGNSFIRCPGHSANNLGLADG